MTSSSLRSSTNKAKTYTLPNNNNAVDVTARRNSFKRTTKEKNEKNQHDLENVLDQQSIQPNIVNRSILLEPLIIDDNEKSTKLKQKSSSTRIIKSSHSSVKELYSKQNDIVIQETTSIPLGSLWKHYKTGVYYTVVGFSMQEGDESINVLYRSLDHRLPLPWSRPLKEWEEKVSVEIKSDLSAQTVKLCEATRFVRISHNRRPEINDDCDENGSSEK